jgi:hypothetical protein
MEKVIFTKRTHLENCRKANIGGVKSEFWQAKTGVKTKPNEPIYPCHNSDLSRNEADINWTIGADSRFQATALFFCRPIFVHDFEFRQKFEFHEPGLCTSQM